MILLGKESDLCVVFCFTYRIYNAEHNFSGGMFLYFKQSVLENKQSGILFLLGYGNGYKRILSSSFHERRNLVSSYR